MPLTSGGIVSTLAALEELEPEPTLDAEVTVRDGVIGRRHHLDDRVVLHVHLEVAADPAVRTDRVGYGLGRLVPGPGLTHVVLALEQQRAGRADADAVAAVHAGAGVQRHRVLGRDPRVKPTTGDRDREG